MNTSSFGKKSLIGLSLFTAGLCGCTPTPQNTHTADAQAVVDAMTYVKSKVGICYGVATVSRVSTTGSWAVNQMIVSVNCQSVGL